MECFNVEQEFEGRIDEIDEETFSASLLDITMNDEYPTEYATFDSNNIINNYCVEAKSIFCGSFFRWKIGYGEDNIMVSKFEFIEPHIFTEEEINNAMIKAEQFSKEICWE